jgi:hypothetical protein
MSAYVRWEAWNATLLDSDGASLGWCTGHAV